jgi:regulator of cell morphogenesis and NO signaling
MITKEMPMCQVLLEHHRLLPLFPRFGMKLGFGEKSVSEVCTAFGVDPGFFLEIANAYLDEAYDPEERLSAIPLGTMVGYLRSTHTYYQETALPAVEATIYRLLERSNLSGREIALVTRFFDDYKKEFMDHLFEEEQHVLPYILELERQSTLDQPDPAFMDRLRTYSIREFEKGHDRLETSLQNLSRLIIKYLPPCEDFQLCQQVLDQLSSLVKDLTDHADMEDKVLIPKVADLEKRMLLSGSGR